MRAPLERARLSGFGWLAAMSIATGCYRGSSTTPAGDGSEGGSASEGDVGDESGATDGGGDDGGPADELPGPNTRLFRLTHAQWENTVRDLLYRDAPLGLSTAFRIDAKAGPYEFDNSATGLEVDGPLWTQYQSAAVEVAAIAASDPSIMDRILPPDTGDETARARTFIETFGRRAFRRPLTDDEIEAHLAIHVAGRELYDDATGFVAGIRAVLEAMLQSPYFLYRFETSTEVQGDVIALSSDEIAARLSYFVWNSMPDDELFAAADAASLDDRATLESHARRMLADPRASVVVERFHDVVFDTSRYLAIAPNPAFFPDAPPTLAELALEELHRFVAHVVWQQTGGVTELLTSTETFANDELAALYGVEVEGAEFQRIDLDPATRRGVLTQIGFLASQATPVDPDPIHRGKFVATRIACKMLPAPPDDIPPLPTPAEGQTNRELVEALTEVPGTACAGCHVALINPFGWPFEGYDAIGSHRTSDRGFPIDATSEISLDGQPVTVDGALELVDALAASAEVHQCYARYWISYAAGRWATAEEWPLVARLGASSQNDDLAIVDLVVEVVTARPFRTRSPQELDP